MSDARKKLLINLVPFLLGWVLIALGILFPVQVCFKGSISYYWNGLLLWAGCALYPLTILVVTKRAWVRGMCLFALTPVLLLFFISTQVNAMVPGSPSCFIS